MAEVTGLRNNALPYPVYGAPWSVVFPMLDADGDLVTGATTPDAERSLNGDTFADCTNESTEIATNSGMYYLQLTAAEMTADVVAVIAKSATSGMKTTPIVLYPAKLVTLRTGTAQTGASGSITLDSSASAVDDFFNGCLIVTTGGTGSGQARICSDYVGSTKVASVAVNWATNPDSSTTFTVYLPWGRQFSDGNNLAWNGTAVSTPATAGIPDVNVKNIDNDAASASGTVTFPNATLASTTNITAGTITTATNVTTVNGLASGVITATSIAADAIGASELASDAVTEIRSLASGTSDSGSTTTMVDAARTEADNNYWTGQIIVFTSGNIAGQARTITNFVAATDTITFSPATTQAVSTQTYEIWPNGIINGLSATAIADLFDTDSGTTYASAVAGSAVYEMANNAGTLTAADIADAVWDEATAGHVAAGSTGLALTSGTSAATVAAAVWDLDATGHQTQGTFGQVLGDSGADTDTLWALANTNLNATVGSRASQVSVDAVDDYVDTEVAAIKAKTDQLTFTVANQIDANIKSVAGTTVTGVGTEGDPWGP